MRVYVWVCWGLLIRASLYVWPRKHGTRRRFDTRCLVSIEVWWCYCTICAKDLLSNDAFLHLSEPIPVLSVRCASYAAKDCKTRVLFHCSFKGLPGFVIVEVCRSPSACSFGVMVCTTSFVSTLNMANYPKYLEVITASSSS